ncbi:DUF3396 domain-containing protein [Streptomyces sp. NBC_01102]|uniref:hypothetical protein n=1 Tax=unclassified Streptomyces TaxID=2593676 RepID=UPI00386A32E1|nr:DUF3396 domain-containing protein [Streptomyces sp. NBC_01102]
MNDDTTSTDVTLWATLDEQAAGYRGDLLVHWFRTTINRLFPADARELSDSWALVTESISGGREVRVRDVRANWSVLADALRPLPFYASAGFHEPSTDEDSWVDDFGRVSGTQVGGASHTELFATLRAGERIGNPAFCASLVDFLAVALDGANPAFARVDHLNFHEGTDLEAALGRSRRKSRKESRTLLRGYSWVTGVPAELAARLGGAHALETTGAFHIVRKLRDGGLLLQATETLAGYDDDRMREVFRALAPVLPPGMPGRDPGRDDLRVVFEDARRVLPPGRRGNLAWTD